ncbi:hypothetical protein [Streptomyces sp. NPDC006368]|uniref:hypothetical protein n=1 Tax=Streptomyces sp. NPDC006368 TaxID=3156760 RepID=UPI0033BF788C
MQTRAAARAPHLITALLTIAAVGMGACCGYLLNGPAMAAFTGTAAGVGACTGSFLARRRVLAGLKHDRDAATADGYATGLAHAVLVGIAAYEAAVFPLTGPDSVSDDERDARRTVAYRIAAYEGLSHTVRTSAAAALEAIDHAQDAERTRKAMTALATTVYRQHTRR